MGETADAIIIGAGVIGAATAFELAKLGWRTLSVDQNAEPGHGSTGASCAIVRVHYSTLDGTALAYEGYFYWRDWSDYLEVADERGIASFREVGCLVMKTEANGFMETCLTHASALGIPFEHWPAEKIRARLPLYDLRRFYPPKRPDELGFGEPTGGTVADGVFFPTAGYVTDPALSSHNLVRAAENYGAKFRFNSTVTGVLAREGRASGVRLADGTELHAPVVINVGGPASSSINQMAGVIADMQIHTRALKQEVVHVPAPAGFDFERNGIVVSDSDIGCYCRPEQGNHILIGSEDPPCDEHNWVDDLASFDRSFTDQWTVQAMRYAQRVPGLGIPNTVRGVVECYDVTPDWIPIYDKSSLPGFYMACGTSGNQYKNAAIVGKMMAALVEYCEAGNDHDKAPFRFRLPRIGREVDVGFYSRNRKINPESSFSVLG